MSWGYQLMGYFAFEHTYGTPEEFQDFVEACHQNNIGVLVDWVPGHYTQNDDALAYFDGTPTFEYQDHDRAHNYRWGALNFDLGKNQVQSFLISSALYWIKIIISMVSEWMQYLTCSIWTMMKVHGCLTRTVEIVTWKATASFKNSIVKLKNAIQML